MKSSQKLLNIGLTALFVALVGIQSAPLQAAESRPRDATGPRMGPKTQKPETEVIRLRSGQLPLVSLTSDVFYRVVSAEIAAQRGMLGVAGTTMVNLSRDTSDPRLARRGLEFFLAGGNLRGALEASRAWSRLSPNDIEANSTELALSAANGQTEGLAEALRVRIDASKDKPAAIGQALAVLSRLNDKRVAFQILDQALSPSARKSPAAFLALSDVAQAGGDTPRALAEARNALRVDPNSEEAAQRLLEYGMVADPARAQADARAYIARHPDARKLRLMLAGQLADTGDYDGALTELQAMAKQSPEDFDLLSLQAQVAYKAGRADQARALLEQYLSVQNQREQATVPGASDAGAAAADAHAMLAKIAEDQGRYDDAVAQLDQIDDPSLRYSSTVRQAGIRAKQGRVAEAVRLIDTAEPLDDDERVIGVLAKAQILRDADQLDAAVKVLSDADRAIPDSVEIKYELAMTVERQGKFAQLEKLLREVIALDPDHAHAYNALGYTLADNNQRLPEAQSLIGRAMELKPGDPFIMDSMGWVKFRLGDNAAAIDFLRKAYVLRPEADIAAHLAEVLWVDGKRDEAQKLLQGAYQKDPKNKTLNETIQRLGVKL